MCACARAPPYAGKATNIVDLRGYGRSMGMWGDYSLPAMAADCLELADRLRWSRFHVIGIR